MWTRSRTRCAAAWPTNVSDVSQWNEPPASPELCASVVHAWRASLNVPPAVVEALARTLGNDERARASRYPREGDRRRFTVARGLLRTIVASYLGLAPSALQFAHGSHGKPVLVGPDLTFNLSHSGEVALFAIARGRRVGIDVEHVRADVAVESLARRFFSGHEVAMLESLERRRRPAAFYRAWTSKEAYLKARGVGLSLPLDAFDVSLLPGTAPELLTSREDPTEISRWTLMDLPVGPDYAAALAVEGRHAIVQRWRWRES